MKNIDKLLTELEGRELITRAAGVFLQEFFERMQLPSDIGNEEVGSLITEMSAVDFSAGSSLDTDTLTGEYERLAPHLLAEGAFAVASGRELSSADLETMLFIFCRMHGATEVGN